MTKTSMSCQCSLMGTLPPCCPTWAELGKAKCSSRYCSSGIVDVWQGFSFFHLLHAYTSISCFRDVTVRYPLYINLTIGICCSVKARAMTSLQETCDGVLQYLEAASGGEVPAEEPLVLPSIRCLGRWADVSTYPTLLDKSIGR